MNKSLTDLLRKKKDSSTGGSVDWNDRRDEFVANVEKLYASIEEILTESIQLKTVALQRRPKQLTENFIGSYSVDDLILTVGDEQVRFSPKGRNIVGASGRVDVLGERGEAMLLLQPDSQWGFLQSRQPVIVVAPFDEASLTEVLKLVMRA